MAVVKVDIAGLMKSNIYALIEIRVWLDNNVEAISVKPAGDGSFLIEFIGENSDECATMFRLKFGI